jgi:hypothetical protein
MKIEQLEPQFAQKLDTPLKHILRELQYSIPDNYKSRVALLDSTGRKKKSNASAENWSPESGRIEIRFEPIRAEQKSPAQSKSDAVENASLSGKPVPGTYIHPAEADLLTLLVKTLNRAESKPGWNFVPLKKFRDEILPAEDPSSMRTEVERQNVLRSAIDKRLILVGKVPNPKAPEFPVTTIRLNRLMPEVQRIIGGAQNSALDFEPVEIRGEPLSTTILRERR